jgi:hypothetical protein
MKTYKFELFTRAKNQEFITGSKTIEAPDYDSALKKLNKLDLPFHHFATVKTI